MGQPAWARAGTLIIADSKCRVVSVNVVILTDARFPEFRGL
jgi:hypothetical protein